MVYAFSRPEPAARRLLPYLRQGAQEDGDMPKYARLRGALARAIDDGLWNAETRLPTEQELTSIADLSLGTVQRAIRALVEEGRVVRIKGRGTFPARARRGIAQPFLHARFLDDAGENLLPVYPRVLSRRLVSRRGPWSKLLKQRGADVLRIERALNINREFDVISVFYINARQFPAFAAKSTRELAAGNFKLMLARDYNLPPIVYRQFIELAPLPPRAARMLGVSPGTVGALFRVTAHTGVTTPLYYNELYFPPNARRLQLNDIVLPTGR